MTIARYFNPKLKRRLLTKGEPDWLARHPRRKYIVACVMATMKWGCNEDIKMLRAWARAMGVFTGVQHVLDHEIPLCHPLVCGLNVETNLRVVPRVCNAAKGNRWTPPEQLGFDFLHSSAPLDNRAEPATLAAP